MSSLPSDRINTSMSSLSSDPLSGYDLSQDYLSAEALIQHGEIFGDDINWSVILGESTSQLAW
jgi:hypothetical protein